MAKKKRAAAEAWDDAERNGMTPVAQSGINGDIVIKELLPYTEEQYGTLLKMWDECVLPDPVCRESWSVFADLAGAPLPGAIGTRGGILAPAPRPAYGKAFHGWPAEVFQMVPGHRPQQMGLVPRRMAAAAWRKQNPPSGLNVGHKCTSKMELPGHLSCPSARPHTAPDSVLLVYQN